MSVKKPQIVCLFQEKCTRIYKLIDRNLDVISIGRKIELNKSTTVSICILRSSCLVLGKKEFF